MADLDFDDMELTEGKSSKTPLIIAAAVAFLVGGGAGVGAVILFGGSNDAQASTDTDVEEALGASEGSSAVGRSERAVYDLGRFSVNLRGAGGGRVLRMNVQIEVHEQDMGILEERHPQLRDGVLTLASDYTYSDLEGLEGKTRLRDELLGRLNSLLGDIRIERIYFTEFVVQ